MKRLTGILLLIVALLVAVPAVFAGGWATVTMDELPTDIHAGEPFTIGFAVLQPGLTPVPDLGPDFPVEPLIVANSIPAGERVEFEAVPTKKPGHFVAEITLPNEGEWAWSITPRPFGEQVLEPITVLPATQAAVIGTQAAITRGLASSQTLLRVAGVGLAMVGLVAFLWQRRRQATAAVPQVER